MIKYQKDSVFCTLENRVLFIFHFNISETFHKQNKKHLRVKYVRKI